MGGGGGGEEFMRASTSRKPQTTYDRFRALEALGVLDAHAIWSLFLIIKAKNMVDQRIYIILKKEKEHWMRQIIKISQRNNDTLQI